MKGLAVSNIAWTPEEDEAMAAMLRDEGVTAIELAPTAWRSEPYDASHADVLALRDTWKNRGLSVVSLQSLLFGRPDLQLFGDDSVRRALAEYMRRAMDFARTLGARTLVFGSPKNRRRGDLPLANALEIAADFFRDLGPYAANADVTICIEANPADYGGDFILTTDEAVELARSVDHPNIRVNGDLGGMMLAGDDIARTIASSAPWLAHFHASEPALAELSNAATHELAGTALEQAGYTGWVSIEMRRAASGSNVDAVRRAIRVASRSY
ncbi:MAG TPA: sugar phosphate isomerase/epimerase family protein [Gemmatimonadaceae bacterium]|nr:sugar phosphate isomerase/epimerase family protein [Gemmatimonadaceae bacterium]